MSDHDEMTLAELLTKYRDGDNIGWPAAFAWVRTHHASKIAEITLSLAKGGFEHPILLGDDGRVWDGHHRLAVADAIGIRAVPIEHMTGDDV